MHQLFATQIYQAKVKTDLPDLMKEIRQIEKADQKGREWSHDNYKNGYTSYGSWDQLHQLSSTFDVLEKQIRKHVVKFAKNLDYDLPAGALKVNSMWVNIMPEGSLHSAHIHPHSVISGTFYVEVPKQASAIKFEDPRLACFMNAPVPKPAAKKENRRFFSIAPVNSDLILFESWLKHEVPLNQSKKPRVSVSFNYGWA